jgi:hypothetical protein
MHLSEKKIVFLVCLIYKIGAGCFSAGASPQNQTKRLRQTEGGDLQDNQKPGGARSSGLRHPGDGERFDGTREKAPWHCKVGARSQDPLVNPSGNDPTRGTRSPRPKLADGHR